MLLKGAIIFTGFALLLILLALTLEYYAWLGSTQRAFVFYTTTALTLFLLVKYVAIPVIKLFNLGKTLSKEEAAKIVGAHFCQIQDKLLNTLELINTAQNNDLLKAAIEQKTKELSPIPFVKVINYKKNLKYLRFAIWPVMALCIILITAPSFITDTGKRVIQYNQYFEKPAPFNFKITNKDLKAQQFSDFDLTVSVNGEMLPNDVFIVIDNARFKLTKNTKTEFAYTFKNVQKNTSFILQADNFNSKPFTLSVQAKPILIGYVANISFPGYLGRSNETVENPSELVLPAGTTVKWKFITKQVNKLNLLFNRYNVWVEPKTSGRFEYEKKFYINDVLTIKPINENNIFSDSTNCNIKVIQDEYPLINIEQRADSVYDKIRYLSGIASDDYGISKITFNYKFTNGDKGRQNLKTISVPVINNKQTVINYAFNLYEIGVNLGDELEYYFEVWDNDGSTRPKSTKSKIFNLKAPDKKEIQEQAKANSAALEKKMEETLKELKDLQNDLQSLQRKLQNNTPLNWEEKRKAEELLKRQKELNDKINELNKDLRIKNEKEQAYKQEEQRILEKQLQLEKMFKEVMTDEMKKLMQQLENIMKMQNKDLINKELNKLELNNKDIEKELDRMLEMYKELEVEKKMEQAVNELKELSKKQEELSEKSAQKTQDKESLKKQQNEINNEFNQIKKNLEDARKENKDLENPKQLPDTKDQEKQISDKLQQSSDNLEKGNDKKAAKEQKDAAEKMEEMANQMEQQMNEAESQQTELDAGALREILENLVQLSKDQEDLMERFSKVNGYNPQFVEMAKEQKVINDNAKLVEDSLLALSKRVAEIKAYVNREVNKMNDHLEKSVDGFAKRNIQETRTQQQYAMTRMNNLAVMLSDVLKQMQQQMQQQKGSKGKGKPKNQKGNKSGMSDLKKMQQELNKQLQEGLNKNGSSNKPQMGSEQFARMAAQQMAIRQQMQKMLQQMDALEKQQLGGNKQLSELQKLMEETEKDLVNKRLTQETLMRQQEIVTRLLEHEKAEKKQDEDKKREAEQAKDYPRPSPKYLEELNKKQTKDLELLKTVMPQLQPYYQQKAKEYLQNAAE